MGSTVKGTDQPTEARRETNPSAARAKATHVDNNVVRNLGTDPIQGHDLIVEKGEHAGRRAFYEENASIDEKTGLPDEIVVRTRDDISSNERLVVKYADCRKAGPSSVY